MNLTIQVIEFVEWHAIIDWPSSSQFCVLIVVDKLDHNTSGYSSGYDELILGAVRSGASSLYFWGLDADRAADVAVFAIAYFETMTGKEVELSEGFMTVTFLDKSAKDVVDLVIHSYLPYAIESASSPTLLVCGTANSKSLDELLSELRRLGIPYIKRVNLTRQP